MINASNINTNTQYTVQRPKIKRRYSALKYGYSQMGTNNVGVTYPFFIRELTPSDKASFQTNINMQFSPFISQLFARMTNEISGYKLPYRVCCEKLSDYYNFKYNWDDFSTGGSDGQAIDTLPTVYNLTSLMLKSLIGYSSKENNTSIEDTSLWSDFFGHDLVEGTHNSAGHYFYKKDAGFYPISVSNLRLSVSSGGEKVFNGTIYVPRFGVYVDNDFSRVNLLVFNPDTLDKIFSHSVDLEADLNEYLQTGIAPVDLYPIGTNYSTHPKRVGESLTQLYYNFLLGTLWDSFGLPMPQFDEVEISSSPTSGYYVDNSFDFCLRCVGTYTFTDAGGNSFEQFVDGYEMLHYRVDDVTVSNLKFYDVFPLPLEDRENINMLLFPASQYNVLTTGVNAMPFIMYNLIYNDVLRFPDLERTRDLFNIFPFRGHEQNNYFTRARIFQQRGVSPMIPVDVRMDFQGNYGFNVEVDSPFNVSLQEDGKIFSIDGLPLGFEHSSFEIDDMLQGLLLMRYQVNNAKMRSRYIDHLRFRFGVDGLDARLQLPEYLGSFYQDVYQTNVVQTAPSSNGSTGLGTITSVASVSGNNGVFSTEAKEHEIIMFLSVCRPDMVIEQGIPKWLTKKNRFDFVIPELVDSPDVPIKKHEIIGKALTRSSFNYNIGDDTFGWTSIYDEYRTSLNQVVGRLRPSDKLGLRSFTLSRLYDTDVELNGSFVQIPNVMDRVKQYVNEPDFIYSASVVASTAQPIPIESEPGQFVDV